jgi:thymidylate kinase
LELTEARYVWLVGPDGSGKSSIADELATAGTVVHYWRPGALPMAMELVGRVPEPGVNSRPHDRHPDSLPRALARGVYYALDYLLGYYTVVRPSLRAGSHVVIDRGWADMVVDPRRYGFASARIPSLLMRLVRKPDALAVVRVDPHVAHERKPELSPEEIARQYDTWEAIDVRPAVKISVDNHGPLEHSVRQLRTALGGLRS